jgi:hypothetical protein
MTANPVFEKVAGPIERIFAILDVYRCNLVSRNSPAAGLIGKLALEIHDSQSHLHERFAKGFDNWTATIAQCLEQASHRIPHISI